MGEALAQRGRRFDVVDGQQGVVVADVADAGLVELAGQPLPAVDVDLDIVGDPALDAHVHEAEVGVDEVEVVVQALALPACRLDAPGLHALAHLERHAGLDRADEAHDALGDPVTFGDRASELLLLLDAVAGLHVIEGDDRPSRLGGQAPGVVGDPLRRRLGIGGEVLQRHALAPQEAAHVVLLVEAREIPLEDHPVEHRQAPGDPAPMKILERAHGHPRPPSTTR